MARIFHTRNTDHFQVIKRMSASSSSIIGTFLNVVGQANQFLVSTIRFLLRSLACGGYFYHVSRFPIVIVSVNISSQTPVCLYTLNSSEYVYVGNNGCGGDDDEHNDDEDDIDANDNVQHGSERDWRRQTLLTGSQFRLG